MKTAHNLTIHDLGIKRNDDQKKALCYSWLTWGVLGGIFLFLYFLGTIMGGREGALLGIVFAFFFLLPASLVSANFYDVSITPTREQRQEYCRRHGFYFPSITGLKDEER